MAEDQPSGKRRHERHTQPFISRIILASIPIACCRFGIFIIITMLVVVAPKHVADVAVVVIN